ncbi:oxidoreductase [Janthinobacterium sp. PC23-8]|nr:oxidoreductase [Janthinobacterium sp. PC23-8]
MVFPESATSNGETTRALVIGYGSIGRRHAEVLTDLGCSTAVLSRRTMDLPLAFNNLSEALKAHQPQYVVVANETDQHYSALGQLAHSGYDGIVLVEKPLFMHSAPLPENTFRAAYVAYNLRFHPIISRLKAELEGEQIISVQAYVGQYLPDWRPGSDYRSSYSAMAERGGGVLRDLSHELDYLTWMLGGWNSVAALGGHFSALEISSDDVFSLLMTTQRCRAVSVQLNYLDRVAKRSITINTNSRTLEADLIKGTLMINKEEESFQTERNLTYQGMHKDVLVGNSEKACTLGEGVDTLRLIEAAMEAAKKGKWVIK